MDRLSKKMIGLMAEKFYGAKLKDDQLTQLTERLETWLKDLREVEDEVLEHEEPIKVVYLRCDGDEGERG